MSIRQTADTRRQIIDSAAKLFAEGGYNGTSTRDIAQGANVNEATIFRHYPHKRDLYMAVLESQLQKVRLRGDLLAEVADAPDASSALANTYTLIASSLADDRLIRMLQFSSLEFGKDIDPLLHRHFRELVEVLAGYLQPWVDKGQLQCSNAKVVVLTFVAIVLNYNSVFRVFSEFTPGLETTLKTHADVSRARAARFDTVPSTPSSG
jgi:AcrR family transcriptional regulator